MALSYKIQNVAMSFVHRQICVARTKLHEENRDITWPAPASASSVAADAANKLNVKR